jgi:RNA polymerase sigma-70 factor (ECF subfamily)
MSEDAHFAEFLRRVRAGDEEAATDLVRRYEPLVRREVRLRLCDPTMNRLLDSMDICQSVMASFFVRAAAGGYDLEQPGHLVRLLIGMARHKLASAVRKHRAQRRDNRRICATPVDEIAAAGAACPGRRAQGKELLALVREQLTAEERQLADRRAHGHNWGEIAAELGGTPDARRVQLSRALDRVTRQLGLEEDADER